MNQTEKAIREMRPVLLPREPRGWLAISPPFSPLRVGVLGATEDEARMNFEASRDAWARLLQESAPLQ